MNFDRGLWRAGGEQVIPRPERWELGPLAPWDGHTLDHLGVDRVARLVAERGPGLAPTVVGEGARMSAVLVALFDGERGAEVLLTRRAWHLRNHKGEVCFPGGRQDPGETLVETALREAFEEVELDPAAVEVVGELHQISTLVSNSHIVPIVGRLAQRPILRAGTSEVDRIFTVPLVDLLAPRTYREEQWFREQAPWPVVFFELDDETVWGATARILRDLLTLATARDSSFVALEKPKVKP